MTQEQKIIRAKVGLLELAKQLGNVSQACKMMGYSRDNFRFKELYDRKTPIPRPSGLAEVKSEPQKAEAAVVKVEPLSLAANRCDGAAGVQRLDAPGCDRADNGAAGSVFGTL